MATFDKKAGRQLSLINVPVYNCSRIKGEGSMNADILDVTE